MTNKLHLPEDGFFHFRHNSLFTRGYAWAFSLVPRLSEIGVRCDVCGNGNLYPGIYPERSLSVVVGKGKNYPDILGCGAYPLLIVSERVVDAWSSLGFSGYSIFPMGVIDEPNSGRPAPPMYFHVHVTGRYDVDTLGMGVVVRFRCPKCMYRDFDYNPDSPYLIKGGTWDGSEVFASDLLPMVTMCTGKMVALAKKYKWTNFLFEPVEQTSA